MTNSTKNSAPIQFRDIVPNPAGGEWPRIEERDGDRNVDVAHDRMGDVLKRVVIPAFLANNRGNVKQTAEMLATLFLGFLHNFLADNVEEGEKKTYDRIAKAAGACMDHSHTQMQLIHYMSSMGMPQPVISAMLHSLNAERGEPDVRVFEIKPGQELPEELKRFLRS